MLAPNPPQSVPPKLALVRDHGQPVPPSATSDFRRWHEAGFTTEILPIIPVDATLTGGSSVKDGHKGKVPGRKTQAETWSGFGGPWSDDQQSTMAELKRWQSWGAGIGMQGRRFPGIDIDVDDRELADAIEALADAELACGAPVRTRPGSPRRLLMLKSDEPMKKVRQEFITPDGTKHATELLAAGQQFVVAGLHPRGGAYTWAGKHPCDLGPDNIPEITPDDVDRFFAALRRLLEARGCTLGKEASAAGALTGGSRKSLDDPALWAPSPEAVLEVLGRWRPEEMAHDEFVSAMALIKAALGPNREDYYGNVLEWAPGIRSEEDEATRKVWESLSDAAGGWDLLAARAGAGDIAAQAEFAEPLSAAENNSMRSHGVKAPANAAITATPFVLRDPASIEPRRWLYGRHYIRGYLSATVAPGGLGKSSLVLVEATAMASGKNLLGDMPAEKLRVWYWNGEDPREEIERRETAACVRHSVTAQDMDGRLFINSGRDTEIIIARGDHNGVKVAMPLVAELGRTIREHGIDLLVIDPFVASHAVPENDNGAINAVCRQWAMLAEETGCAIELVHQRSSAQAKDWAGNAVADVLDLDMSEPEAKASAKAILKALISDGSLKVVERKDDARKLRTFVKVGKKVNELRESKDVVGEPGEIPGNEASQW